ncbi:monovalent cation:proton antiporter-2 (CPA2) family protein [Roseospira marina]|uniref:monovalent cation:proton antiporter-2 (CPA2) family protein n=1 Tax=Roseospira marina TaxID=140057 RepID=UPI001478EE23|nr:monovalent cation:proton antiporter-2 (CPA2) family protein [Roseospira marina]MBB4312449.1 monovalent cation:proton antiporter-2 (CPA2) family protein [Roseospira marina]MBB5085535.1 monovalent cation:proton antiporter-2 (CPA2) family protein [Roseospira marina]
MTHEPLNILALLAGGVIGVTLFQRLGLGSVLGYLVAGLVIGPWGLGMFTEGEDLLHFAELGVVFLLFLIGIELKPARLWLMRKDVFGLGSAQLGLTGLALAGLAWLFGLAPGAAVIVGFGLALSSTAIGLQLLADRGEFGRRHGRAAFGILLFQDLAVVPLLVLVSLLAPGKGSETWQESMGHVALALGAIAAVIAAGHLLLGTLYRAVAGAHNQEVFAALSVLIVLGVASLMETVGLSMAMGAFLAGLMMADSEFRHQIMADIEPFRGFLLGLFFMAVGMSIDVGAAVDNGLLVAGLVAGLLVLKGLILFGLGWGLNVGRDNGMRLAVLLCQGGEFGFVLFTLATQTALIDTKTSQLLILVISLTMALTPVMVKLLPFLLPRTPERALAALGPRANDAAPGTGGHVIIAGYGRVGQTIVRMLEAAGVSYRALDLHAQRVAQAREAGQDVFYGDASRAEVLRAAGLDGSRAVIITLDQPEAAERATAAVRRLHPEIPVFARARDPSHVAELVRHGVTGSVAEALESSLQLGAMFLRDTGDHAPDAVQSLVESLRDECTATGRSIPPRAPIRPKSPTDKPAEGGTGAEPRSTAPRTDRAAAATQRRYPAPQR